MLRLLSMTVTVAIETTDGEQTYALEPTEGETVSEFAERIKQVLIAALEDD